MSMISLASATGVNVADQAGEAARQLAAQDWATVASGWWSEANQYLYNLPHTVNQLDWPAAAVMLVLGVISLLYGFRVFKAVVVIYSALVGAGLGYWVATGFMQQPGYWWLGALLGGLLLAVLAWPLINFFVGLWGAAAGGLVAVGITYGLQNPTAMMIAMIVGMVLGAILAVLIFRFMIIVMTSIVGGHLTTVGAVALMLQVPAMADPLRGALNGTPYLLPMAAGALAVFGIIYQLVSGAYHQPAEKSAEQEEQ